MRIFLLFFPVFFFCGLLHAQTVKVEYGGDPLPDKDRKKIEQFLQHEVDFYSQFGLPDTLSLQLYVFENRREAIDYLESINVSLPNVLRPLIIAVIALIVLIGGYVWSRKKKK